MILKGCSLNSGGALPYSRKPCNFRNHNSTVSGVSNTQRKVVSPYSKCSWEPLLKTKISASSGVRPLHLSTPLLNGGLFRRSIPKGRILASYPVRAGKDVPYSYRYPPMEKKPKWYWRTLACLPYLMPLHQTWLYAEPAYHLHPFLEDFEFLTYPFFEVLGKLPRWFLMAYFFVAYLGVVRRKEWPHFLRFHVVMGILLDITLQVIGNVSQWMPLSLNWGKVGMHLWAAMAFAYLFTVLECIRCALAGMYADVPFVSDAAYIQIPYE